MQNKLCRSREAALKEKSVPVALYGCTTCGFVFNAEFDPKKVDYSAAYDNTPDHSVFFRRYLDVLAKRSVFKRALRKKSSWRSAAAKECFSGVYSTSAPR